MTFPAGTVFGRYEIRSQIGAGGMGEVYKAADRVLLRPVAIKFIRRQPRDARGAGKRFLREARMASQLNHPNIVTIHEICETDEHTYIVMEYVEGRNLRSLIRRAGLGADRALDAAVQIADALAEAHAHGIVHRDIKPENILVNARGQVKLVDFGLARALEASPRASGDVITTASDIEHLTDSGAVVGTVPYMSPEQIRQSAPLDHRTDIFSFGVVLYEMLTGEHPFRGANMFEVGAAILGREPLDAGVLAPGLPPGAARLLVRMLEKDRDLRAASCAEVREALVALRQRLSQSGSLTTAFASTLELEPFREWRAEGDSSRPASGAPESRDWSRAAQDHPTVLVLPLESVGAWEEGAFVGVGMASVITTVLAKINGLSVLSKSAGAVRLDETGQGARELARTLGASILLEGEVMRAGQSLRITARLIDVASGRVIWGDQYRGQESDLFQIQDAVCESVAAALRLNLQSGTAHAAGAARSTSTTHDIDAFVFYSKGRAYLERYDLAENLDYAIRMFEEALAIEPKFALAYAGLAEAFWRKYESTHDQSWVPRALAAGDRALVLDPQQAQVHVSLGMVYYGTGRTETAIEEFRRAINLQPMSDDAYAWLGRCHMRRGEMEESVRHFNRAIEIRPGYWGNYNNLGHCYYSFGHYAEAAEQFRRVISIQPDNTQGYNNLGGIYCLLGRYEDAAAMHQRAIEIHPSGTAYSGLGTNFYYLGRDAEAVSAYENAIGLDPANDLYYRNLGDVYLRVGRDAEAVEQYELASRLLKERLAVNPDDAQLLGRLAVCQAKLRRQPASVSSIERAITLEPHDTTLMYQSAAVYAMTGQAEKAMEYLGQALSHGYSRSEAQRDPDLDALRERPEYQSLFEKADGPGEGE